MKRRNEYDVTNRIKVTDYQQVRESIREMYKTRYPRASFKPIHTAFEIFNQLFTGQYPGYHPCDTLYHDIQHSLDVTLGAARLIDGYDKSHRGKDLLGAERAAMGIITALFHDAGYIRKRRDNKHVNGAEYTKIHVTRSAAFLKKIMPELGMADYAETASKIVHYSGYEISPVDIKVDDPKDKMVGYLMGTGDLMAQMSDRCYLEKCRDRLYPEFVLGGLDRYRESDGRMVVIYESPIDLLYKTPAFYRVKIRKRLEYYFDSAYIYAAAHFGGIDLYVKTLEENITYLERLIAENNLDRLRRRPPRNIASEIFPFEGTH
jgi:hypothetical protein